jgi:hypothetical protein
MIDDILGTLSESPPHTALTLVIIIVGIVALIVNAIW